MDPRTKICPSSMEEEQRLISTKRANPMCDRQGGSIISSGFSIIRPQPSREDFERVFLEWLEDGANRHSIEMGGVGESRSLAMKMHLMHAGSPATEQSSGS